MDPIQVQLWVTSSVHFEYRDVVAVRNSEQLVAIRAGWILVRENYEFHTIFCVNFLSCMHFLLGNSQRSHMSRSSYGYRVKA